MYLPLSLGNIGNDDTFKLEPLLNAAWYKANNSSFESGKFEFCWFWCGFSSISSTTGGYGDSYVNTIKVTLL